MEFPLPSTSGFTVYGKTGCSYCEKVKALLTEYEQEYRYINCDQYLLEHKDAFLDCIAKVAGKEYKTFPMVFSPKGFLGGYTDTVKVMLDTVIDK